MTEIQALLDEVRDAGVRLATDGQKLSAIPAGVLPEPLKVRLRERKPDIIRALTLSDLSDLSAGAARLEAADIRVAVFVTDSDAGMIVTDQIVQGESAASECWQQGATVFSSSEMLTYVGLSPAERRLFLSLKQIQPSKEQV